MAEAATLQPAETGPADIDARTVATLSAALERAAAPGETEGLDPAQLAQIATVIAQAMRVRQPGTPVIHIERQTEGLPGMRRMALVAINDDTPFLVDSTTLSVQEAGLASQRLLHPVVEVRRDAEGRLVEVLGLLNPDLPTQGAHRESIIYLEVERAPGGLRQRLQADLETVYADVRAAVVDWRSMLERLLGAARNMEDFPPPVAPYELQEDVAFLRWLAEDNFTLLGWRGYRLTESGLELEPGGLGLLRDPARRLWNGTGGDHPESLEAFVERARPLLVAKSDMVSTVHRRTSCDYVTVKRFDLQGRVTGEDRFIGLFTSSALYASPRAVPLLRRRVNQVITDLGFDPRGHSGKALIHVLETFPREELFQTGAARLRDMALGLLSLTDRPRPRLFLRSDPFGRQVSALVYLPRETYSAEVRLQIGQMLEAVVGAGLDHFDLDLRSERLARIHYLFGLDGSRPAPEFDEAALNKRLVELFRGWDEALETELALRLGNTRAARILISRARIFSTSYRAQFSAAEAAGDVVQLVGLEAPGEHAVLLYRRPEDPARQLRIKIYRLETVMPLSDAVPVLERFGFRVIEEYPFDVDLGRRGWIHDFLVEHADADLSDVEALNARIAPALKAVIDGRQENDGFNALVVAAGLDAGAVAGLRAFFRYFRQTGATYSEATVVEALRCYPGLTNRIVELFRTLHHPAQGEGREERAAACRAAIAEEVEAVELIDHDRILRFFVAVVEATLRTNAFARTPEEAFAFKLESTKVPGLPPPVPHREIFVYSPRVEGVHLRGGPVARGGIRWSDRRDDYRTEILGLVKAQIVKNAIIVPTGAKGGFVPKNLPSPSDRDAWIAEGTECYRTFIRALLSVTDNIVGGEIVPPEGVVRRDGDDPYLVVAADKGTATFSDVANAIAVERGFWLGDAFASGGSAGYDHKAMGITARGAWVSVRRHFAELGIDVQHDPVRVVGIGDMSGDVFGNGMLLSQSLRLIAAFDHRHIFLDPHPDPKASWAERQRLFELPRSSWADYDPARISAGGGVFPRTQKAIPLSSEVRAVLGVEADELSPSELIRAILRAPADLLWLGGIGTYAKADAESHGEVGDRANDMNRVDAEELRVKVVGEGANLGLTQAARVVFARRGGRINTDFIDNSAGVDTSDHEVNIKIALAAEMREGGLTLAARDALLAEMTDDVSALVLEDNERQTQILSVAERRGAPAVPSFQRVIQTLEEQGRLDREVEGLPSDEFLAQRAQAGEGLQRPELAVLLSYAKLAMYDALVAGEVVDDPVLETELLHSFPRALASGHAKALKAHRLRREIIATTLSNEIVNRGGIIMGFELAEEGSAQLGAVGGAYVAAREIFGLQALWKALDGLPPSQTQLELLTHAAAGLRVQMADILRCYPDLSRSAPSAIIAAAHEGVRRVDEQLDTILRPEPRAALQRLRESLEQLGAPPAAVAGIVRLHALDGAIAVARTAADLGAPEVRIAQAYTLIGQRLGLDWAKGRAAALAPYDPWERLLVATAERDLEQLRFDLIRRTTRAGEDPVATAEHWLEGNGQCVAMISSTIDRARRGAATTSAMLAHIAARARVALTN